MDEGTESPPDEVARLMADFAWRGPPRHPRRLTCRHQGRLAVAVEYSFVIPVLDEEETLPELHQRLAAVMDRSTVPPRSSSSTTARPTARSS